MAAGGRAFRPDSVKGPVRRGRNSSEARASVLVAALDLARRLAHLKVPERNHDGSASNPSGSPSRPDALHSQPRSIHLSWFR